MGRTFHWKLSRVRELIMFVFHVDFMSNILERLNGNVA